MKAPIFMPNNSLFFHNSRIVLFYFMIAAQPPEGNSIHPIIQRLPLPCNDGFGIGKPTLHIFARGIFFHYCYISQRRHKCFTILRTLDLLTKITMVFYTPWLSFKTVINFLLPSANQSALIGTSSALTSARYFTFTSR